MSEPLKNKWNTKCVMCPCCRQHLKTVRSAVEYLKEEIGEFILTKSERVNVDALIDEAFSDVTKKDVEE